MTIEFTRVDGGFIGKISPPHSGGGSWSSVVPMNLAELVAKANELGVPVQDFWYAMQEAGYEPDSLQD
jgi:hypothetical protein